MESTTPKDPSNRMALYLTIDGFHIVVKLGDILDPGRSAKAFTMEKKKTENGMEIRICERPPQSSKDVHYLEIPRSDDDLPQAMLFMQH